MKVLLVQLSVSIVGSSLWPPLSLGYLATALKAAGHDVRILDCSRECRDYAEFPKKILAFNPDVVGFSVSTMLYRRAVELARQVKSLLREVVIVFGGPHVSALPEKALPGTPEVDYAIRGEGEVPIVGLLREIEGGTRKFASVPGLIYRNGADSCAMNESCFAPDVDVYGMPDWESIDPAYYFSRLNGFPFPVHFSRGCPFPCTFCAAKVTSGRAFRRRSLDNIFNELDLLYSRYGIDRFGVYDEGFGASKDFMMSVFGRCIAEELPYSFSMGVGMRLDQVDEELLDTMKRARVTRLIALGIESGSERILRLMRKNTNLDLVREKVGLMKRMGFRPAGYFIIGYPSETVDEIRATIRFALELPLYQAAFANFQPLPATEATRMLMESGELPADFDFSRVDAVAITYAPKGMTTEVLQKLKREANLRFYLRPMIMLRFLFEHPANWRLGPRMLLRLLRDNRVR